MGGEIAIRIEKLSHEFGTADDSRRVTALSDFSFDIAKGEFVCLIGPSGCGKSTVLNAIAGLIKPSAGTVLIDGTPVTAPRPKDIAFVFQDGALFPWATVLENAAMGLHFQDVRKKEREDAARAALHAVGLKGFDAHYPGQLSGGMRQRVALARALSVKADILLMDEPFAALDEQTRIVLGEELSGLLARQKKTIVFVTHSLSEAVFLGDRVVAFTARPGRIKEIITIDEPHPRQPQFMQSEKFNNLRIRLFSLLHDEMKKTMSEEQMNEQQHAAGAAAGA